MSFCEPAPPPTILAPVERRFFPRFDVSLMGVCSINLGPDVHCTSIDISVSGIALRTTAPAEIGDAVIVAFREFGMAKGRVARLFEGGFALAFDNIDPHRSRLSQYLVWLVRGVERDLDDDRQHDRIVPLNRIMTLSRGDGSKTFGRVQNLSRSGIAFTSTAVLAVGEAVVIGRHPARILRVFDDGAAAAFDTVLDVDGFDVMISFARL